MFFVVTVGLIEAGYVDIARSNVQTTEGKLATIAHWRRYAALVRTLSEYFRLKCVLHAQFTIAVGEPFIVGALITAVSCGAAVMLFFFRRYVLSIAAILTLDPVRMLNPAVGNCHLCLASDRHECHAGKKLPCPQQPIPDFRSILVGAHHAATPEGDTIPSNEEIET